MGLVPPLGRRFHLRWKSPTPERFFTIDSLGRLMSSQSLMGRSRQALVVKNLTKNLIGISTRARKLERRWYETKLNQRISLPSLKITRWNVTPSDSSFAGD